MPKPELTRRQLVQRRRARIVRIAKAEKTLERLRADLVRLDATIEAGGGAVRAYTPTQHPAPRGAVAKAALGALRQAGRPMTAADLADALAGEPWVAKIGRRALVERIRVALIRQGVNGTLRRDKGPGRMGVWSVTR
jgi:hypothetical protein